MSGVSIIIPCYNAGSFLLEAVSSVKATAPNTPYEIIIVNDASSDAQTQTVLQNLAEMDPVVRIFNMCKNSGQSAARNYAIEVAKYDVILPLDADDKMNIAGKGSYLDFANDILTYQPEVLAVTTDYRQFGAIHGLCPLPSFNQKTHLVKNIIPPFTAYRKRDLIEVNGYNADMRFGEDWDISVTLLNKRLISKIPACIEKVDGYHIDYRTHRTGLNASVKERIPRAEMIAMMMARSPEIYDHYFSNKTANELASSKQLLSVAFDMAARDPLTMMHFAQSIIRRKIHGMIHSSPI